MHLSLKVLQFTHRELQYTEKEGIIFKINIIIMTEFSEVSYLRLSTSSPAYVAIPCHHVLVINKWYGTSYQAMISDPQDKHIIYVMATH